MEVIVGFSFDLLMCLKSPMMSLCEKYSQQDLVAKSHTVDKVHNESRTHWLKFKPVCINCYMFLSNEFQFMWLPCNVIVYYNTSSIFTVV